MFKHPLKILPFLVLQIDDDTEIQELDQEGVYKYLGVDESDGIRHSKMKDKKTEKII